MPNAVDSYVTPATYIYRSAAETVGTFEESGGIVNFINTKTPGEQTVVSFKYDEDPAQSWTFKREFYRVNSYGTDLVSHVLH